MDIVVMKFGGTSVRDQAMRYQAFRHIRREVSAGYKVVVVVSAMGRHGEPYATDSLKELVTYHLSNGSMIDFFHAEKFFQALSCRTFCNSKD